MRASSLLIPLLALALVGPAHAASLTEPATVFYGRVVNANGGDHLVHEGELVWTISGPDQGTTVLRAALAPHDEGRFCYYVEVPHHVLASGLVAPDGTVGLASQPAAYRHVAISLDGRVADIKAPGDDRFDLATAARAATYRLDLSVSLPVEDSDGDGMPDWWENLHGLDPDANDASLDPDGDGISNLDEYLGGTGPGTDNRGPELLTSRLVAYTGATTGVLLRTVDVDSAPEQLVYTLVSLPASGSLRLRGAEDGAVLGTGDTFTHADIENGRLVLGHGTDEETQPTKFTLRVRDETSAHAVSEGEIEVVYFDPAGASVPGQWESASLGGTALEGVAPERQKWVRDAVLGREFGYVIWDLVEARHDLTLAQPTDGLPNTVAGGSGDDHLTGGPADDFIAGGAGADYLTGGPGADRFLFGPDDGHDRIADFSPAEGDVIDVSAALAGISTRLTDYLRLRAVPDGSELAIDTNGDGSGFTDLVLTLEDFTLPEEALYTLVENGNLFAGSLVLPPLVTIVATDAEAGEAGPNPGVFTLTRRGPITDPLVVALNIGGTATNGVDYSFLPGTVTLPAGVASVEVIVLPYADSVAEGPEVVEARVLASPAYTVGSAAVAQVVIENLKPQIWLESLVPVAAVSGERKGIFLVHRSGDVDAGVLLRFQIGGTARSGSDYVALPVFLTLSPQQTFALVEVTPRSGAQLAGGPATVVLTLLPHFSYASAPPTSAEVVIVPETLDLETWRARHFEVSGGSLDAFAATDSGNTGIVNLLRYGFGLDPADPRSTTGLLPTVAVVDGHLTLRYHREMAATDLTHAVEVSDDLRAWRAASASEIQRMPSEALSPLLRVYRSTKPVTDADFQYMRVRVSRR